MDHISLGMTGIEVSRICFGTLVLGHLQKKLDIEEGARLIAYAFEKGINFVDTAQLYKTYGYIRRAMRISGHRPVIATKSYAWDGRGAEESFLEAVRELGTDTIDIFLLHEQESEHTLRGHRKALEYYLKRKKDGFIRAVGISAHTVAATEAAADMDEIDVIHPMLNVRGLGIPDGSREQMEKAIEKAYKRGKGIYTMKALGGGNLINDAAEALDYIYAFKYKHSVAIGMLSRQEIDLNTGYLTGETTDIADAEMKLRGEKSLHIDCWCSACGKCVKHCSQHALSVKNGKLQVDRGKCVLCGYCSAYCPEFAIKIH